MRNGDVYKINSMLKNGATEKAVLERFKWDYSEKEIKKFLPKETVKRSKQK